MPSFNFKKVLSTMLLMLGLASCSITQKLQPVAVPVSSQFKYQEKASQYATQQPKQYAAWWLIFDDDVLNQLIDLANTNNADVQQSLAHYYELVSSLDKQIASSKPILQLIDTGPSKEGINTSGEKLKLSFGSGLTWEPDLWGKVKENIKIAQLQLAQGVQQSYINIQNIQTLVTQQYFLIRTLDENVARLNNDLTLCQTTYQLIQKLWQQHKVSQAEVIQAELELERVKLKIQVYQHQRQLAENYLAILVGVAPSFWKLGVLQIAYQPTAIPHNLPVELLHNRQEVSVALYQMQIENSRLGIAKANRLPDVSINLRLGREGGTFRNLIKGDTTWSVRPRVTWDILDFGRSKAERAKAENVLQQARLHYWQTLLTAVKDVEDALLSYSYENKLYLHLQRLQQLSNSNVNLMFKRYQQGLVSYLELNHAQRLHRMQQKDELQAKYKIQQQVIQLVKALGGRWQVS